MLKIEVIKFEAMDIITASNPAPNAAPAEQKCICSPEETHQNRDLTWDHGNCPGNPDGSHNCDGYIA